MSPAATARASWGYRVLYAPGTACPGCGPTNWHVGRTSAECARCATALPLAPVDQAAPEIAA